MQEFWDWVQHCRKFRLKSPMFTISMCSDPISRNIDLLQVPFISITHCVNWCYSCTVTQRLKMFFPTFVILQRAILIQTGETVPNGDEISSANVILLTSQCLRFGVVTFFGVICTSPNLRCRRVYRQSTDLLVPIFAIFLFSHLSFAFPSLSVSFSGLSEGLFSSPL